MLLHPAGPIPTAGFSVHWSTVIGIGALGGLYVWRSRVEGKRPTTGQGIAFAGGLLAMFLALNGPLHDLSDYDLFSAHMVQHLVLIFVVAPLLVAGTPGWMLRPALGFPGVGPVARWLTGPKQAFVIFNLMMIGWHLPGPYNLAMAVHPVHIVEHLMFLAAAVLMWWPFLSPLPELPRLAYPGQMLYCFLLSIPMSIVAIYITMAERILYPAYEAAPRVWGLSPLDDQKLGGLIMWIPGGIVFYIIMSIVFFKWAQRGEDHAAAAQVGWRPS
ncbi:MAG TPA: cytochrome c oxidase assembly protein [Gemmatimonadaceae bacterium]|nr:cytochrome c oxidase assembly protein [Gemmatimonadaceae bacterium]